MKVVNMKVKFQWKCIWWMKTNMSQIWSLHNNLKGKHEGGKHEGEVPVEMYLVDKDKYVTDLELGQDYALRLDGLIPMPGCSYEDSISPQGCTSSFMSHFKLATLKNDKLLLIDILTGPPFSVETFDTKTVGETDELTGPGGVRVWGAAWNFKNVIYFAADDGKGVYSLEAIKNKTAFFEKKGEANQIDWNDGFTCVNSTIIPDEDPSDCKHDFYQVTTTGGTTSQPETDTGSTTVIRHLDPDTGKFIEDFKVNKKDFGGMKSLNACAINPKDQKLYCHMEHESYQAIVTVDKNGPSLKTKFDTDGRRKMCFAAVFDSKGTYWFWCGGGSQGGDTLYSVAGLDIKKGKLSINDADVKDDKDIKSHCCNYTEKMVGADFVTKVEGDKTYLVSIVESATNDVSVIDITDASKPGTPVIYTPDGLPEPQDKKGNIWGSAWTAPKKGDYAGRVFFARDADPTEEESMGKLYEMTELDTTGTTAKFKEAGKAENAAWHDGFACQEKIVGIDESK